MAVDRRLPLGPRVRMVIVTIVGGLVALGLLFDAIRSWRAPESPLMRYAAPPAAPRVFVTGQLLEGQGTRPIAPICVVTHETFVSCGKTRCWRPVETLLVAEATLEVTGSSSPVPPTLTLGSSFSIEPGPPSPVIAGPADAARWQRMARERKQGFTVATGAGHRIVQSCLPAGADVFIEGCIHTFPDGESTLTSCPDASYYGIVVGSTPQPALDCGADRVALRVGGAFLSLLAIGLALRPRKGMLVDPLAERAGAAALKLRYFWALLAIPPVAGFINALMRGIGSPEFSSMRGGLMLELVAMACFGIFARSLHLRRRTILAALAPVLASKPSPLATARGAVELEVRARSPAPEGVSPILGRDVVAFAEARIFETYRKGKHARRIELATIRPRDTLEVVDESGDGVLQLGNAVLDVELRTATFKEAPPRVAESGLILSRHPHHMRYIVEERVIAVDERLYVLGDITNVALRPDESGYRSVRGSPTLGDALSPPVLVHAGDARGLVRALENEARLTHRLAVASLVGCATVGLLAALLLAL